MRHGSLVRQLGVGATLAAALVTPAVARGQGDSVRITIRGGLEDEIDRVARALLEKRRIQLDLSKQMQTLTLRVRTTPSEEVKSEVERTLIGLQNRLRSTAREGIELRRRLGEMCNEDEQSDGWLGVVLESPIELQRETTGEITRRFMEFPTVVSVEPGSPAAKSGLEAGDRVLFFGGRDVRTPNFDIGVFLQPGARLPVKVRRGVQNRSFTLVVERRPEGYTPPCPWIDETVVSALREVPNEMVFITGDGPKIVRALPAAPPDAPTPRAPAPVRAPMRAPVPPAAPPGFWSFWQSGGPDMGAIAGAQLTTMNEDLADVFGVDRGLLVIKVLPGTPAEQAGLRGGDVIVSADGTAMTDAASLQRTMARSSDRRVNLSVVRKRKAMGVALVW